MGASEQYAAFNVTARYPDMVRARRAVEGLEEQGVEADDISLTGEAAAEAQTQDTPQRDRIFLKHTVRTALRGIMFGGGIGLVLGLLFGFATVVFTARPMPEGMAIVGFAAGGAVAGAGVGLLVSFLARQKQSQAWETSLADVSGPVTVGVHSDDAAMFETAVIAFEGTSPQRLHRFDARGQPLTDAQPPPSR
ncbi:MAG: hypothetical protein GEU81_13325 [Nitriliruptorales bacterium]|nr:hypothetical protein [Nitriliruptorales bacterium]